MPDTSGPPNNPRPGQIDISLSLLNRESEKTLTGFIDAVGKLNDFMSKMVNEQKRLVDAINGLSLPVGGSNVKGVASSVASTAAASAHSGPRYSGPGVYEQAPGHVLEGGAVRRPREANSAPYYGRDKYGDVVARRHDERIRLPRYGKFNSQDIFDMITDAGAKGATSGHLAKRASMRAANAGYGKQDRADAAAWLAEGKDLTNEERVLLQQIVANKGGAASTVQSALGGLSYGADKISGLIPYAQAGMQMMGSSFAPYGPGGFIDRQTAMGYAPGGTDIGPLRLPGIDLGGGGVGPGGLLSPAAWQSLKQDWQSLSFGFHAGGSARAMAQFANDMNAEGYSGTQLQNMMDAWGGLYRDKTYGHGATGSSATTAPLMDEAMRYGSLSMKDFIETMKEVPSAARAAKLNVDDFKTQLKSFAEADQQQGATPGQGMVQGTHLAMSTGLSPTVLSALYQNPMLSAITAVTNGVPPQAVGILNDNQRLQGIVQSINLYEGALRAAGIGGQEADAMVASQLGIPMQAITALRKHGQQMIGQNKLANALTDYKHHAGAVGRLGLRDERGAIKLHMEHWSARHPYGTNSAYNKELKAYERHIVREFEDHIPTSIDGMLKAATQAGMSKHEMDHIFGSPGHRKTPDEIDKGIKSWISHQAKKEVGNSANYDNVKVAIDLTPAAKKWIKAKVGQTHKQMVNNGQTTDNAPAATYSDPSPAYRPGPGDW